MTSSPTRQISLDVPDVSAPPDDEPEMLAPANRNLDANLTVLIAVPTLDSGTADKSAIDLVKCLHKAGHRPVVVSKGGRLLDDALAAGAEFVQMNVASKNPLVMARCARKLARLVAQRQCDVVHALGRTAAWSAYFAARANQRPFVTTWFKGFREQNRFKRLYNSVMVRADRVIASSEALADLIRDRYELATDRLTVLPSAFDADQFNPETVSAERIERMRRAWGVSANCRVILAPGRMVRRKGHDLIVQAAARLKASGIKDFMIVFTGEDQGRTRFTGALWDLVLASGVTDVVRFAGLSGDLPAALAASTAAVFASTQVEGVQQTVLAAQTMGVPVIASDLSAGPDIVLSPPTVSEDRMTGLRFTSKDSAALALALSRILSFSDETRAAIGARGRAWMADHRNAEAVGRQMLELYAGLSKAVHQP